MAVIVLRTSEPLPGPFQVEVVVRGSDTGMWNATSSPVRLMEVLNPGGSEEWFEELTRLDPADPGAFDASCRRHGISFDRASPWTAELARRFGLGGDS
jgi:hypothetical protein